MHLTFADYKSMVKHSLSGGDPNAVYTDADTTKGQIVNEAGAFLFQSHPWAFLSRPPLTVTSNTSDAFVELPQDFKQMDSVVMTNGLSKSIRPTTMAVVQQLRATSSFSSNDEYWYAIAYPNQASKTQPSPNPRMELFPTPSAPESFDIVYRAGWETLTESTQVPNLPGGHEWESLLSRFVRAFARDQDDERDGAIDTVMASALFQACVDSDSATNWNLGQWTGGVGQSIGDTSPFNYQRLVADPS